MCKKPYCICIQIRDCGKEGERMMSNIFQRFYLLLFFIGLSCDLIGLSLWVKENNNSKKHVWMISLGIITTVGMYLTCCFKLKLSINACIVLFAFVLGLLLLSVAAIAISIATWMETKEPYRLFTIINIGGLLASMGISQMITKIY